jgi:hypothetical protein
MRTHSLYVTLVFAAMCLVGSIASARGNHFMGPHPVAAKFGGGYCYIEAPHIHVYAPDHPQLYQRAGDQYVFAGDPTPFGYDGEKHPFYGNHPIVTVGGEPVFCYIDGPHFHAFAPPDVPDYKVEKGVAFYVGAYPPSYRPQHYRKVVNAEYRPYVAMRPTIEVTPPPMWHGEVWVAPPAIEVAAPGVVVGAPGVAVSAPGIAVSAPGVYVGAPGVYVGGPGVAVAAPGVVVAPPHVRMRAPAVEVAAPGVYVGAPGVAVEGGVYVEGHHERRGFEHHDNGRHNGWHKH